MYNLTLRTFDWRQDSRCLYAFLKEDIYQNYFPNKLKTYNQEAFEKWLSDMFVQEKFHDFFIIESGDYILGFTFSYDFSSGNEHCHYTLCLYEDYINTGFGAVAGLKMIDYLFKRYPLKQIYISVAGCYKNSLESSKKGGFEEVGILPDYTFVNGEYHSLHILRITRNSFYENNNNRIDKIIKGER